MISLAKAKDIKDRHSERLLQQPGVWGVGVEVDANQRPILVLHVDARRPEVKDKLPTDIEGCPVKVVTDGPIIKQ